MDEEELVRVALKIENAQGRREVIIAAMGHVHDTLVVRSIPALVYGVAYGDVIRLLDKASGDFQVLEHNGQVTVRVFVRGSLDRPEIRLLIESVLSLNGIYEIGRSSDDPNRHSLLLVSLDIAIGLANIERMFQKSGHQWEYGNIYDEEGKQLGWWHAGK